MHAPKSRHEAAPALDHATIRSIIIGIMLAMFLAALDQTIIAAALPTIGSELGDLQNLAWVVTSYLLSSTAVTPLYGKLSDIHGRRTTLLFAIVVFIVGSIACAMAPTMFLLILARFLQGLGGGGLISLAQTIIGDVAPPKERARYQGYIGGVFALASVAGPVLGGVLSQLWHWTLIFWINVPLGVFAFAMTSNALRKLPQHQRKHRLDYVGAGLMVAATMFLLLALSWGGTAYPWASIEILGLFAASVIAWVLFGVRLAKAPEPFLPLGILKNPVVAAGTISAFFGIGAMVGLSIFLPLFFQSALRLSVGAAGFALIALSAGTVVGATFSGRMMSKIRHYKRPGTIGIAMAIPLVLILAFTAESLPFGVIELILALAGMGIGTLFPITTVAVQNAVPPHQLGTATGTVNFMRALGSAVVVAVFGAIFLAHVGGSAGISVEEMVASASDTGVSLGTAFRDVFLGAAVCLAISLAALMAMEERPLLGRPTTASVEH